MTNTYLTGNPLGSTSPKDLYDNASDFDEAMNSTAPSFHDRFNRLRETWTGQEVAFDTAQTERSDAFSASQEDRTDQFNTFLLSSGYETPVDYVAGISVTRPTQILKYLGELYRPKSASLPFTTTVWATDSVKLIANGDNSLRQDLASLSDLAKGSALVGYKLDAAGSSGRSLADKLAERVSVKDFGAAVDGVTNDTAAFQAAYDATVAGGTIFVPGSVAVVGTLTGTKFVVWESSALTPGGNPLALPGLIISTIQTRKLYQRNSGLATDYSSLQIQRTANYSGGTPGVVSTAFEVDTTVSNGVTNFEWAALFKLENNATGGENVAVYGQATKKSTGPTWAACFEIRDEAVRDPSEGAALGIEITCAAVPGADTNRTRNGVNIAAVRIGSSGSMEWGRGFWTSSDANTRLRECFTNTANYSEAVFQNNASVVPAGGRGALLLDLGSGAVGVDTSSATYSTGVAIRLASAQKITFEATDSVGISYAGGALVAVGAKLQASSGLSFPSAGLTSSSAASGGASALPGTPATYLSVWVDGTLRKIPLYA